MNEMKAYALGIDLGGQAIKWGVVGRDGSIVREDMIKLKSRTQSTVIDHIASIIDEQVNSSGLDIAGVGIGSPGLIDATRSTVRTSPNFPDWDNIALVRRVREKVNVDIPVVLENDANVLVYSETRWGAAVGMTHVVVLTLGTGVGGGVMVDGKLLRGVNGGAGELGHIPIDVNGPACGTKVKGSFEAYCNIEGVMREAHEVYLPDAPPPDPGALSQAADRGDERAIEVWRRVGYFLGAGVAAYINIFNPEAVLIGGGIAGAGEHLFKSARLAARSRCYAANWADCTFARAHLREKAGLLGAAAMAFDEAGVRTTLARPDLSET